MAVNYSQKYRKEELTRRIGFLHEIFRCIINGKSGSGKTNLLLNILSKIFDEYPKVIVIICSKTLDQFLYQEFIKESLQNHDNLIILQIKNLSSFDNKFFEDIKEYFDYKKVIVLDDIGPVKKEYDILNYLFSSTRPLEISVFYLSQRYTQLDIRCRQQINYFITFKQSDKDLKFIYKELLYSIISFEYLQDFFKKKSNYLALFCDLDKNVVKSADEVFSNKTAYIFYNNINDLINQLKVQIGEKNAGNDCDIINNKIKHLLNELEKNNVIKYI